jgi:GntR family transcriptional regulator, transcriptional repressor for pyruvate dehydrogenase complex
MTKSPSLFEPLARRHSLTDEIAKLLRERVLSGDLAVGERLPSEQRLAESFQVSRTVIREAISRLKTDGLIETKQGLGAFVAQAARPTRLDAGQIDKKMRVPFVFELRTAIEPVIAGLAARRRSAGQLASIEAALTALGLSVETGEGGPEADAAFHWAIAEAAGNPLLMSLVQFAQSSLMDSLRLAHSNMRHVKGGPAKTQDEHEAIFAAINARDEAAARRAAQSHLVNAAARLSIEIDRPG